GFFFQAEDGIRDFHVTGVQTCALPICVEAEGAHGPVAEGVLRAGAVHPEADGADVAAGVPPLGRRGRAASALVAPAGVDLAAARSEERRVGTERRARGSRER